MKKRVDALLAFYFFFFFLIVPSLLLVSFYFFFFLLSVFYFIFLSSLCSDLWTSANSSLCKFIFFCKHCYIVGCQHQLRAVTGSVLVVDS